MLAYIESASKWLIATLTKLYEFSIKIINKKSAFKKYEFPGTEQNINDPHVKWHHRFEEKNIDL